jgi:hypothetical protein
MKRWFYNPKTKQTAVADPEKGVIDIESGKSVDLTAEIWWEFDDDPRIYGEETLRTAQRSIE